MSKVYFGDARERSIFIIFSKEEEAISLLLITYHDDSYFVELDSIPKRDFVELAKEFLKKENCEGEKLRIEKRKEGILLTLMRSKRSFVQWLIDYPRKKLEFLKMLKMIINEMC